MDVRISFFNFSVNKITSRDNQDPDNGRIGLLYYGLLLAFIMLAVLQINIYYQQLTLLAITNAIMLVSAAVFFKFLTYRPKWRIIAHALLIIGTLINFTDVFIILQNVDATTIGTMAIIVLFSFYMLGVGSGLFYSLLNILPIITFVVLQYNNTYLIDIKPEKVNESTVIIALSACCVLMVFIFGYFYRAFLNSNNELIETNQKQNALNKKYELAIEKAEKSFEAKSEFLSTMSHEIRTPLNAVIGMSNLLMMGSPRPDQKENLEILKFSASNLLNIVNDVLDFNKIESGKQVFENTKLNLGELMQNICGGQIISAREKGLEFSLEVEENLTNKEIFGDPTRITQVVFNLISNAIKFTHKGNIWVKVTCLEDRHNLITVSFSVKDTGIGIDKNKLNLIFEPFTQESLSTTRQYGGTGLGLAIVKRLLESQGLRMQVSSRPNVGSEFSFSMEFPVATEKKKVVVEQIDHKVADCENTLNNLRVLIAEDNPVNVMLMKKLLSKWQIAPTIAENGERAVELMHYGNFDIILMDLQMPLMNGFDAAVAIRKMADPQKSKIPIIALTASALFDIKEKVYASGMNEYVSKPFKPSELLEKIQMLTAVLT